VPYSWPLKPFDRAHPVRAYFNDPRISGSSRAFHFGIDVSAPNGTPVYAVEGGTVHLENESAVSVDAGGREFGYWHIVPAVVHRQRVARPQLLGHVEAPWLHVHFAERRAGEYRNPLRAGALTPWRDTTKPRVTAIEFQRDGKKIAPSVVGGAVDVVADAFDTPPKKVPAPWNDLPVTPAALRWRVRRGNRTVRAWHTPVDFAKTLVPKERYAKVYAAGTRQNHAGKPGRYRFFLAHTWSTKLLPDGDYVLEVEARDLAGNVGAHAQPFRILNEL